MLSCIMTGSPKLNGDHYRILVEHSPTMVWRAALDAHCDYFNETWLAYTGRSLAQEIGNGWVDGVHAEDLDRCMEIYLRNFAARTPFEMEYRLRRHDGEYRYIFDRGVPYTDDKGAFAGFIGSCVDIEDRRRAERSRTTFLSMMAHELRTPLNSLLALPTLLRGHATKGEPPSEGISAALERLVRKFSRLVDELSDGARLEEGRPARLDEEIVDVPTLLREVHADAELALRARKKAHALELAIVGAGRVRADRQRLSRALGQLLDNAVKYSPPGAAIRIRADTIAREVAISVEDTGIGIPDNEIHRLTDRYFRASNASVDNYSGIGLGLAVVAETVAGIGGKLVFESEVGIGTKVKISLPLVQS